MELLGEPASERAAPGCRDKDRAASRYLQLGHTLPHYEGPLYLHRNTRTVAAGSGRTSGCARGRCWALEADWSTGERRAARHRPAQPRSAARVPRPARLPPTPGTKFKRHRLTARAQLPSCALRNQPRSPRPSACRTSNHWNSIALGKHFRLRYLKILNQL